MNSVDVDGFLLLNTLTKLNLIKPSYYPRIATTENSWRPRVLFIGDSFSQHVRYAMKQANAYSELIMSSIFGLGSRVC